MLADLHPHVLALPFTLLALALALNLVRSPVEPADALRLGWQWLAARHGQVLVLALCLGALGFLNSWDFPTYTGIVVLGFALRATRHAGGWTAAWSARPCSLAWPWGLGTSAVPAVLSHLPVPGQLVWAW